MNFMKAAVVSVASCGIVESSWDVFSRFRILFHDEDNLAKIFIFWNQLPFY